MIIMSISDIFNSSLKRKWIDINFSISAEKDKVDILKEKLLPYAKELNWEIKEWKNEREPNKIIVFLIPKLKLNTRAISPLEFKKIKRKLYFFAQQIAKDLGIEKISKQVMLSNVTLLKKFKGFFTLTQTFGFLAIQYNIRDRIKLEKKDKELSKDLFDGTVSEFLEDFSKEDKNNEWIQEVKKMIDKKKLNDDSEIPIAEHERNKLRITAGFLLPYKVSSINGDKIKFERLTNLTPQEKEMFDYYQHKFEKEASIRTSNAHKGVKLSYKPTYGFWCKDCERVPDDVKDCFKRKHTIIQAIIGESFQAKMKEK